MLFVVVLIVLFVQSIIAQDIVHPNLPEASKARLSKGAISVIAYSPDGSRLAIAGRIGIWLYDVGSGTEVALLTGHTHFVTSVTFSPDGRSLASGSWDGTVRQWEWGQHSSVVGCKHR